MNFKKLSLSCTLALASLMAANASNIDVNAARMAANNFVKKNMAAQGMLKTPALADIKLAHAEASSVEGNAFYVFNIKGGGWVIIAGDDRAKQVLAYGNKGNIDMSELPGSMKDYLDLYKHQIEEMQSYKGQVIPMKAPKRVAPIEPLTKSTWGQQEPMNRQCPTTSSGKTSVGCAPLAMAQILYYWKYPAGVDELPGYSISWSQSLPSLPATTFDYSLMLDKYTVYNPETGGVALGTYTEEQANEVAKLARYCGQACLSRYGNSGTSTGTYSYDQRDAFKKFGYNENIELIGIDPSYYCSNFGTKYTEEEWKNLIYNELSNKRPIAYHNVDFIDGHAWVIDGIDADGKYHMNWGFYERFDGWFEFGAFTITPNGETWNFNGGGNEMIINLYPYEGYVIPGGDEVTPGDVNGDDTINISDVTALIDMILSNSTDGNKAADVNGDGIVNISDVTALIDSLLN